MVAKKKVKPRFEQRSKSKTTQNEIDLNSIGRIINLIDPLSEVTQMNLQDLIKNVHEREGGTLDNYIEKVRDFLDKQFNEGNEQE